MFVNTSSLPNLSTGWYGLFLFVEKITSSVLSALNCISIAMPIVKFFPDPYSDPRLFLLRFPQQKKGMYHLQTI